MRSVAQILRNRQANFARENAAQIKWAASHFLPEHFQRRRIGQIARQQLFRALDPFARDPFLAHAEKLRVLRQKKKMRHELERFALIPENLRGFRHRRLRQRRHNIALLHGHRPRLRDNHFRLLWKNSGAHLRIKIAFAIGELFLQMFPREFEGNELMTIVERARDAASGSSPIA